ncbi:hypothetical protein J6590_108711 [Homalodisca vitripennis]|nr:hypothetical protein J6590_108711 [Homalodisca vitripennis]
MIFVNYGGGKYWFFEHSAWNGVTIADFVFPWFAWVMGVSLVLSYRSKLRSCVSRRAVFWVSLRRTTALVALGLLVNMFGHDDLSTARFCGVLQRLGMAHLVVSTLEITFMKKQPSFQVRRWLPISELVESWCQWLVIMLLVAIHLVVTFHLPVPGCPTGYLGPGGVGNYSWAPHCTGGAARHIDTIMFSDSHLYDSGPVKRVYHTTVPFDPEGILGTLTTCLTVYLGVVAGYIILCYNSTRQRCTHWLFWALLTGVISGSFCGWSQEGGLIPVNKQLWSLSFALLTSASGFLLLAILFVIVDHFNWWSGSPFRYAGMNAILLYIGHIITRHTFPWSWKPYNVTDHKELFLMNVSGVVLWLLISKVLHSNEIFFSV